MNKTTGTSPFRGLHCGMLAKILLFHSAAAALCAAGLSGQKLELFNDIQTAKRSAHAAALSGNYNEAVSLLSVAYQRFGGKRSHELSLGSALASLSFQLRNEGNLARASDLAVLAIARLAQPEGKMSRAEAAESLSLAGDVARLIFSKVADARQYYERSIAQGGDAKKIGAKLELVSAIERISSDKARGNEVLRQRLR